MIKIGLMIFAFLSYAGGVLLALATTGAVAEGPNFLPLLYLVAGLFGGLVPHGLATALEQQEEILKLLKPHVPVDADPLRPQTFETY